MGSAWQRGEQNPGRLQRIWSPQAGWVSARGTGTAREESRTGPSTSNMAPSPPTVPPTSFRAGASWGDIPGLPGPTPTHCWALLVIPNLASCSCPGFDQAEAVVPPGNVFWGTHPLSLSVKASGTGGAAWGIICWSLRPASGLLAPAPFPIWAPSPTNRSLRPGRSFAGTHGGRMPLGGFVSGAQLPAQCEVLGGAEALVAGEVDPDFKLWALTPFPAFERPFRTRTAFSSAWVRSSSSLRS